MSYPLPCSFHSGRECDGIGGVVIGDMVADVTSQGLNVRQIIARRFAVITFGTIPTVWGAGQRVEMTTHLKELQRLYTLSPSPL